MQLMLKHYFIVLDSYPKRYLSAYIILFSYSLGGGGEGVETQFRSHLFTCIVGIRMQIIFKTDFGRFTQYRSGKNKNTTPNNKYE